MAVGQRRQSFAPTSTTVKTRGTGRKRAQSLIPGDTRQLVPRKSILKSSTFTFTLPSQPNEPQQITRRAQSVEPNFGGSALNDSDSNDEDEDINSGEDYRAEVSDTTSRKSLGRRVSFAPYAQYRVFETSEQNTNSSGGPSSSPTPPSPSGPELEPEPQPSPPMPAPPFPRLSNENDYPGRRQSGPGLRRFSTASGLGESSMSLDMDDDDFSEPPTDPVFFNFDGSEGGVPPPSSGADEEEERSEDNDEDNEDNEDMEITEAIALNISRKRSLSTAEQNYCARKSSLPARRRSSARFPKEPPPPEDDEEDVDEGNATVTEQLDQDITTASQGTQASEGPMEFTIALEKPLKKPRPPSDAWLALQAMANTTPNDEKDEEEMELDSAISRLRQARASLDLRDEKQAGANYDEPSYTSSEDSMEASIEVGEQTLNVTQLMGAVRDMDISGDGDESRSSKVTEDEDFARPIASVVPTAPLNIQRKEDDPAANSAGKVLSNVFSAPPASTSSQSGNLNLASSHGPDSAHIGSNHQELGRSHFPTSVKPPVFKPATPSRIPVPSPSKARTVAANVLSSKKRPASQDDNADDLPQPSPAKRRAIESTALNTPSPGGRAENHQPADAVPTVVGSDPSAVSATASKPSLGMRRPSGYFAQRRSLAGGGIAPLTTSSVANRQTSEATEADNGRQSSKKAQMRRASIAAGPRKGNVQDENELSLPRAPLTTKFVSSNESGQSIVVPEVVITHEDDETEDDLDDLEMVEEEEQNNTLQWRASVSNEPPPSEGDYELDDVLSSISIEEFIMMTGVKFMDELTIPRRSTIHPSQLGSNRRDSTALPSLTDFVTAMTIHIPQLQLYSWVAKDLQTWIDNSKKIYQEAEDEVGKVTPSLFREFSQANEEGRAELLHQLKLIKANKHSAAKAKWYEWKHQWMENLLENADRGHAELEQDSKTLSDIIGEAEDLLPALRQQHAQIIEDLKREQTEVNDLEQSDPAYLEELKAEIEEQNQLLEVYRTDIAESNAKRERLEDKLQELGSQKQESLEAIEAAERKITLNKNSTRAEVFRLKGELECLQALHSWRVSKVSSAYLELVFSEELCVSVPCRKFRPLCSEICISRMEKTESMKRRPRRPNPFPLLGDLTVSGAQGFIRKQPCATAKELVGSLSDFWTSTTQVRTQLKFLTIKYPLALEPLLSQDGRVSIGFKATASILLHKMKAKALVTFVFNENALARWPFEIQQVECEVKVAYGIVSSEEVRDIVTARLAEASVEDSYACLLDSCVEAASFYE